MYNLNIRDNFLELNTNYDLFIIETQLDLINKLS